MGRKSASFTDRNNTFNSELNQDNITLDFHESQSLYYCLAFDNNGQVQVKKMHQDPCQVSNSTSSPTSGYTNVSNSEILEIRNEIQKLKTEVKNIKKKLKLNNQKVTFPDSVYETISKTAISALIERSHEIDSKEDNLLERIQLPIVTCEDVLKLEQDIRNDSNFRKQLIRFLTKIGGTTGEEDGLKIGYKLVDIIFCPEVLTNYTWTGVSRANKSSEKKAFQAFEGIVDVIYEVLSLADRRVTKQKVISLFKAGVLKHAKKRSQRKRFKMLVNTSQGVNTVTTENHEESEELPDINNEISRTLVDNSEDKCNNEFD